MLRDPNNDISSVSDKNADQLVGNIVELELSTIEVNPNQPRTSFNEESLRELASSIRELGVIQPITVRKLDFNKYQLVSGERRYRASRLIGLSTIPAYIRIANDQESLEMALVENIQRQDLDPVEIALSYQRLIEEVSLTQEELSERVGKNRSTIANYLRLLKLDPIIQTGMRDGFISMGHGRALINIEDPTTQLSVYEKILRQDLSVRDTEAMVRALKVKVSVVQRTKKNVPAFIERTGKQLEDLLETPVKVKALANKGGQLIISFKSEKELQEIVKRIKGEA